MNIGLGIGIPFTRSSLWSNIFTPTALFMDGSTEGVWYDPSDVQTLFQDAAGTTPVTSVEQPVGLMLDKSGRGNHAYQTVSTKRPVLSARVNQYLATETLATQNVTTLATGYTLRFSGAGTITLSGTATGVYSAGTHAITCTAGTLTSTVSGTVTQADLRPANSGVNLPSYQRVNTDTDYDTQGFPTYLKFDGIDDALQTNSIDFSYGDKMFVSAGVRKLSDGVQIVVENGIGAGNASGTFGILQQPTWTYASTGTALSDARAASYAPITNALTGIGNISGDQAILRVNGAQAATSTADQGTGNYGNYPLYIGARAGTSLFFNGNLYQLVIAAGSEIRVAEEDSDLFLSESGDFITAETTVAVIQSAIEQTEAFVNRKTLAY